MFNDIQINLIKNSRIDSRNSSAARPDVAAERADLRRALSRHFVEQEKIQEQHRSGQILFLSSHC
jgi:hypothetical protein